MRITGGDFRGRALAEPPDNRVRPTSDKVRQAIFNILAHSAFGLALEGAKVIDLFAGTGALGLEALSRGASFALFVVLSQDYLAYGGALAVAALVGAVGGLFLGRLIDSGRGTRAVWLAVGVLVLAIALRASLLHDPVLAIAANAIGALVGCLYTPTMMTAVYNQAKRSPCVLRFHIAAEGGWDLGVSTGLSLAALIVWLGFSLAWGIALAFLGAAFVFVLLLRYYRDHASERIDPHEEAEFPIQPAAKM